MAYFICTYCNCRFGDYKRLESHFIQNHKEITSSEKLKELRNIKQKIDNKKVIPPKFTIKKHEVVIAIKSESKSSVKPLKLKLYSRRSEKYDESTLCNKCGKLYQSVWKFNNTNKGVVFLCSKCKHKLCGNYTWISIITHGNGPK